MSEGIAISEHPRLKPFSHPDTVLIAGGTFTMGSDRRYPKEAPRRRVSVSAFRIDRTPVTNRQFKAFVAATGHIIFARQSIAGTIARLHVRPKQSTQR